jgi:acetyl-CoA synthetase (ADP-forming)
MDNAFHASSESRGALSEHEAKKFLLSCGIPICRGEIADNVDAAAQLATRIGFPVVLKASGRKLLHKTDIGGVVTDLRREEEVIEAGKRLLEIPGCEALSVQEMVEGDREFVCGMVRDDHFGPCVMFGIGGIFTEIIQDVEFRLAPITEADAMDMILGLRNNSMLGPIRGQPAVDTDVLSNALLSLSEIGLEHLEIEQIDINPMKIRTTGKPVAVDALIILGSNAGLG